MFRVTGSITALACHESHVASASVDCTIILWFSACLRASSGATLDPTYVLRAHEAPPTCLSFNSEGTRLVSGIDEQFLSTTVSALNTFFRKHLKSIHCLFSLISGGKDKKMIYWNLPADPNTTSPEMKPYRVVNNAHRDWLTTCCYSDVNDHVVSRHCHFYSSVDVPPKPSPESFHNRGVLRLCGGAWHSKNWQKLNSLKVFHVSIWGDWSFVWKG